MNRLLVIIFLTLASAAISGCSARVRAVQTDPSVRLRSYKSLALVLTDATGSTSMSGGVVAGVVSGQVMKGEGQAAQALNSLRFELAAIGFRLTSRPEESELVGEFSIGQIRYDPITGWIADQAMLAIKDKDGNAIALFRAKSSVITPTVNNLVSQIAKAVKKTY